MSWAFRCTDLHKAYGAQVLLDGATFDLDEQSRCAIIGRNGAGKSTLVKILLGIEELDAGEVERRDGLRVGYLKQNDPFLPGETVLGYLMRSSDAPDWRCGEMAGRFLLNQQLIERPIAALSGGFQTRARLCSMLLAEPDFLVLDEPTNYLDLRTLVLLERFLASFRGGWVIVSHDRGFLGRTCGESLEVSRGRVRTYPGTVDAWLRYKAEQRKQAEMTNANLLAKKRQLEEFVAKNKARATTATRAQSKMKQIERLDEEFVDVEAAEAAVVISMPPVETRSGWAIQCNDLAIGYGEKTVAKGIQLDLDRGLRIAVLGDNGQGKTTFLRTVAGSLPALGGAYRWAGGLRVGLYAQDVFTAFKPEVRVRDHLERTAREAPGPTIPTQQILDLAGALLFRGDDLDKKVGVLSGGERARLCLAGLLLGRYQVLLLDEPTNHLDVESVEALAEALKGYLGTILFTCHDRAFTATVATQLVEVKDGQVAIYPGDYALYCQRLEQEADRGDPTPKPEAKAKGKAEGPPDRGHAERVKRQAQTVERQLAVLNAEKTEIENRLGEDYDEDACNRLVEVLEEIRKAEEKWLELSG